MTPELTALTLAALLQVVQFALYAVPANIELGPGYTTSARPRAVAPDVRPHRPAGRAYNHFEGLILFTIACVVIAVSGQSTGFTAACAWIYLAARVAYIPAYYLGLRPWRSLIWMVGFAATALMYIAALA
ncbi:MAG: MAPEG family protein [Roseovarius sp.]